MDFFEKPTARLKYWLDPNQHHKVDYENFARQLEEANQDASAQCLREMIALTQKSGDCLTPALEALERSSSGIDGRSAAVRLHGLGVLRCAIRMPFL